MVQIRKKVQSPTINFSGRDLYFKYLSANLIKSAMNKILFIGLTQELKNDLQQAILKLWPDSVFDEVQIADEQLFAKVGDNTWLIVAAELTQNSIRNLRKSERTKLIPLMLIADLVDEGNEFVNIEFLPDALLRIPFANEQVEITLRTLRRLSSSARKVEDTEITENSFRTTDETDSGCRNILDSMMEGCQIIGLDWRYKYVNKAAEIQNRRPASDLIGNSFLDVWPDIEGSELYSKIKNALENRNNDMMDINFEFSDGKAGYFELKFQPVPEGVLITSFDITRQKIIEKGLYESDERWQFALEGADHGVWDWNLLTNKVLFSAQWKKQLGYQPDELENDLIEWETRVHPDDLVNAKFDINQHVSGITQFYESEFRMKHKNGMWVWILDRGKIFERDESGKPLRMVGTHTDITLKKQLETDLKESERIIRESQKVAGIGTYSLDFKTGIWKSSEVLDAIFGIEKDFEHSVEGWGAVIHPDWRETMVNYFSKEVATERKEFNKVYKIQRINDLEPRWVHGLGRLEYDLEGNLQQMIGTIQDITERKEAQDALIQNQRILKLFVEYAPAAIAMFDRNMCYMAVSNRFISDNQLEGVELIGKSHYEIIPNIPERWKEIHSECMKGVVRTKEEDEYIKADGTKEWLKWEVRPWFEVNNEVGGILLFTELITEHKKIIKALEESEERFRMIVESAPVGIAINDMEGNIVYINKFSTELFGYTPDDIPTVEAWMKLAYPDDNLRHEVFKYWKVALELAGKGENMPLLEYPVRCKNGEVKQIDFRPAISNNQIYIILTDLTDKYAAQEELRRIEWMLTKKESEPGTEKLNQQPAYGDLTLLNKDGLILKSVGKEVLTDIVNDYLSLLETSSAIYEKNGDYALGIFSSGWCQFMDEASRNLCATQDNSEALACGKWHCHESCWKQASLKAIETNAPVDIECSGGIRLYALPVLANNEIIGALNFGYGNPPTAIQKLSELSEKYNVPVEELEKRAAMYETRPPYIIGSAKERLQASANLIGEIVTRKISEQKIIELNESLEKTVAVKTMELKERIKELERFHEATIDREFRIKELRDEIDFLRKAK